MYPDLTTPADICAAIETLAYRVSELEARLAAIVSQIPPVEPQKVSS